MSVSHLILLFLILLLIFGPSRLEGLGVSLGRAIRGFKKGLEEGSTPDSTTPPPSQSPDANKTAQDSH